MSPDDAALLERWTKQRDAEAFNDLVSRHADMVYAACKRVLGNAADAEEVAQECFLKLATGGERIRTSLGGWLHSVATSLAITRVRSDVRRRRREEALADRTPTATEPQWDDLQLYVDAAIAELPAKLRDPLVQHFLQRKTHDEIARELGVSRPHVSKRIAAGVEGVRAALRRKGIVITATLFSALLAEHAAEAAPATLVSSLGRLAVSGVPKPVVAAGSILAAMTVTKIALVLLAATGIGVLARQHFTRGAAVVAPPPPAQQSKTSAAPSLPAPETKPVSSGTVPVFAPGATAPAAKAAPEKPADVSIQGRVYDAQTGAGIPGVRVNVYPTGGGTIKGEGKSTGPTGAYTIPRLAKGSYSISPTNAIGYPESFLTKDVTITADDAEPVAGVDFALEKGIPVAGTVVDLHGNPVAAKIAATTGALPNPIRGQSDGAGKFTLYMPRPAEDLALQAQSDTLESVAQTGLKLTTDGLAGLRLMLDQRRTGSISGVVVDRDGGGMAGAQLHIMDKSQPAPGEWPSAKADRNGKFQFVNIPAGLYAIIVTPEGVNGFSTSEEYARVTLAPGQAVEGLRILFGEKGGLAIAGHVTNSAGKPIANASVRHYGETFETAYTKNDGAFVITGLTEGDCALDVEHADYSRLTTSFPAGTLDAEIVLKPRGTIKGRVTREDTGAPLTSFTLAVLNGEARSFNSALFTGGHATQSQDGTFTEANRDNGPVTVAAWAPGFAPTWKVVSVDGDAAATIELALKAAPRFDGVVVDESGRPVSGAGVYFVEDNSPETMERSVAARTGSDGRFSLDSLSPDAQHICAYIAGHGIGITSPNGDHRIVLPAQCTIEGAIDWEGAVFADMNVNAYYSEARYLPQAYLHPNTDGSFRLTGLSPGDLTLSVFPNMGTRHTVEKTLHLEPGQTLHVDFKGENGAGVVEGVIDVAGGLFKGGVAQLIRRFDDRTESLWSRVAPSGAFRFEKVWAGPATLVVICADPARPSNPIHDEISVTLAEGQTLHQDIHLNPLP